MNILKTREGIVEWIETEGVLVWYGLDGALALRSMPGFPSNTNIELFARDLASNPGMYALPAEATEAEIARIRALPAESVERKIRCEALDVCDECGAAHSFFECDCFGPSPAEHLERPLLG